MVIYKERAAIRRGVMLGLTKGKVFLCAWSPAWEAAFLQEKEKIQTMLGSYAVNVHHIGSTAVKGLSAKPIIDIAVEIKDFK